MPEHETGPKRKPDSEQKGPPKRERPVRGEKKGKKSEQAASPEAQTVIEASKSAQEADPKFEKREALLREACEQAKQSGKVQERDINKLITLLKKKDQEQLTDKEKAGLWKLLLLLLKLIWKEVLKLFKEQEYAELMATAKTAGAKSDTEMLLWMIGETGIKASNLKELEDVFMGKAFDEGQKEGKRTPEEERRRLEHMREGGIRGGKDGEERDISEMSFDEIQYDSRIKQLMVKSHSEDVSKLLKSGQRDATDLGLKLHDFFASDEGGKRLDQVVEELGGLSAGDIDTARERYAELRELFNRVTSLLPGRESPGRFLSIYGPRAMALMDEIDNYKRDGVYKILASRSEAPRSGGGISVQDVEDVVAKLKERSQKTKEEDAELSKGLESQAVAIQNWVKEEAEVKGFDASDVDVDVKREMMLELKETIRREVVKPLMEKIIGDAEDDPREGFRMESWGFILMSELTDAIRSAGPQGRYEKLMFENELFARRVVHTIHGEVIKRGDPEMLLKIGGSLFSEDLDTLMRLEAGLGPARRIVERVLSQVRIDPEHDGRIPFNYLSAELSGEYEQPKVEKLVGDELMALSKAGILLDIGGRPISFYEKNEKGEVVEKPGAREEAERLASLALKVSNLEGRTAEHISAPLPPKTGEQYISSPQDKLRFDYLRYTAERFEQYGRGREALLPMIQRMNQMVQPWVFEKIPGEAIDDWDVNPENFLQIGGTNSQSSWRIEEATEAMRTKYDLALGVTLFKAGDAEKGVLWSKVGIRNPTVISRYFATLALRPSKNQDDYFDLQGRFRKGLIRDEKGFFESVEDKAKKKMRDVAFKDIKNELLADVESKSVSFRGGKVKADALLKKVETSGDISRVEGLGILREELAKRHSDRTKELRLQIGAQAAFLGVVAEAHGIPFQGDWENEAWKKWDILQAKLIVLEEMAILEHVARVDNGEENREDYQKSVLDLARERKVKPSSGEEKLVFSDEELKIVENLMNLGNTPEHIRNVRKDVEKLNDEALLEAIVENKLLHEEEKEVGVTNANRVRFRERLAQSRLGGRLAEVKFSFTPFTEDILHEKAEWKKIGPPGITRRYNDIQFATTAADIMWKISNGLAGQQDKTIATRQELLKSLVEFQNTLIWLSEPDRQKVNATLTHEIINNLFKADAWWLNIPLVGPLLDMEWPWGSMLASSRAQKKFGLKALSMTAMERWRFIEDMRPFVGNQYADKLQLMLKARRRDVVKQLALQWGLPAGAYLGWEWFLGPALKQLQGYMSDIGG